jgi:microcystin degradation protein MlrC
MTNSLVVNAATLMSTTTVNRTNAEWSNILGYFIADWASPMPDGLTVTQQNQWRLDQVNAKLANYLVSEARRNRRAQLQAASTVDAQATADASLG